MNKNIVYIQYTNPANYPPLEHSSRILMENGWHAIFLGVKNPGMNTLSFPPHKNITVRLLPSCRSGALQKLHYLWFCAWVFMWTLILNPDWVYASDLFSCLPALVIKTICGKKVIYHEHDHLIVSEKRSFQRIIMRSRRAIASTASACVVPNEERLQGFEKELRPKNAICVWNCPTLEEAKVSHPAKSDKGASLYYHGVFSPGSLPQTLLQALATLSEEVVLIATGYETIGAQGYTGYLTEEARRLKISHRVKFIAAQSRYHLLNQCRNYDVGLVFFPASPADINTRYMIGASNKFFDYLACGLAVLVSGGPEWIKMCVSPGYGLACNAEDPTSIASALRWFFEHRDETRKMGEAGRERILKEWNYEKQFGPVLKIISGGHAQSAGQLSIK